MERGSSHVLDPGTSNQIALGDIHGKRPFLKVLHLQNKEKKDRKTR